MKIAVASDLGKVSPHFGHCESFEIFTVDHTAIQTCQTVVNPGHKPGFLPYYLHDLGVDVVITGGMGANARRIFEAKNMSVIIGAEGPSEDAVAAYLRGELTGNPTNDLTTCDHA